MDGENGRLKDMGEHCMLVGGLVLWDVAGTGEDVTVRGASNRHRGLWQRGGLGTACAVSEDIVQGKPSKL